MDKPLATLAVTAERLGRTEIFRDLSEADLMAIAEFCHEETYHERESLLVEGEPAEKIFIVERGKLALDKKVQLGRLSTPRNATIAYVGPDEIAGFSTLIPPHFLSTSVICVEATRVLVVDGIALRTYLDEHTAAGLKVMRALAAVVSQRYRHSTKSLTYFLSIVSHELRSPLAAIESYLQTLHGGFAGELEPKQQHMIQRCLLRVGDLKALIGDVVDLARMRPEQIQADFEWFDPGEVGAESIEDAHLAAAEKNIRIKVEPPEKFEPIVGARRRMRQVFTNLLNNAIKFSPPGSAVIFRAWYEPEALIFEVEDSGAGIPEHDLPHIFEDFYRASNIEGTQGSGLGLSIAKKIMDAHKGQILVRNLSDEPSETGTSFKVVIPLDLMTPEMRRRLWAEPEEEAVETK
jgi:signal transduction histidine kinase